MELRTPQAIHKIKLSKKDYALIEGKKSSILQAMSFAINYHKLDVTETQGELLITGTDPVIRVNKYLLK